MEIIKASKNSRQVLAARRARRQVNIFATQAGKR